jgi:hypothetical protein
MTVNANNARIYGGDSDSINLAPLGTALPSGPTGITDVIDGAFEDVGWLHSDGVTEEQSGSKTKIRGHQGMAVVRTRMTETGTEFVFHALESKAQTQSLRYIEKASSTAGGVRSSTRSPGQKVSVRAAIIDFFDADDSLVKERFAIPRFEITPDGERAYGGSDISGFPFRGEIIGDYYHWMNAPTPKTVWTLTITGSPTGGTFTLLLNGFATAPIAWNATNSTIAAALNAISGVTGISGIVVTLTGPFTITLPSSATMGSSSALTGGTGPVAVVS